MRVTVYTQTDPDGDDTTVTHQTIDLKNTTLVVKAQRPSGAFGIMEPFPDCETETISRHRNTSIGQAHALDSIAQVKRDYYTSYGSEAQLRVWVEDETGRRLQFHRLSVDAGRGNLESWYI